MKTNPKDSNHFYINKFDYLPKPFLIPIKTSAKLTNCHENHKLYEHNAKL